MRRVVQTTLVLAFAFAAVACGKNPAVEFCLGDDGTYQDCGIACDVTKDEASCTKFKEITTKLCEEKGKDACQELCEGTNGQKNETACDLASKME